MNTYDIVIMIVCGILFVSLSALLVWWLKIGERHFIEKRCPWRLKKEENGTGAEQNGEDN